jgi:DNA-binding response OmpR family regulator
MGPLSPVTLAPYQDEHLTVDFERRIVSLDSDLVSLTRKEYALLALLVANASEIVPRDALLREIWGYGSGIRTRTLDVHVRRVRKKLGAFADQYIETIFGIGYRFQPYRLARPYQGTMTGPVAGVA